MSQNTMTNDHPWNPSEVTLQELARKNIGKLPPMKKVSFNWNDRFQYREDMSSNDIMLNEISSSLINTNQKELYYPGTEDIQPNKTYVSFDRHNQVTSDKIAEILCIGPDKAKKFFFVSQGNKGLAPPSCQFEGDTGLIGCMT